ncbi:MAG: major facilitator superfamily protein [Xanthobacteraceae bacterium]|nr:major facilitator superfamily protein [Xanthobacteraceae bacterium]
MTVSPPTPSRKIPSGVWALGFVSLTMDLSSEMIHALLPLYMVTVLGASALAVGVIEGIAEATASIVKVFSGVISDWLGRRKLLAVLGYGLAMCTRPVFPLAESIGWLIAARFVDRIGKGIRGAPRDALIADLSPPELRGASFGLRQSLDTVGAFLAPLVAIGLMLLSGGDFTLVFWIAVIPAVASVVILIVAVREPERPSGVAPARWPLTRAGLAQLSPAFWIVVGMAAVFTLARFSEAFLLLRAHEFGVPMAFVPVVLVVMNVVYALAAWPAGEWSDRIGRFGILTAGFAMLFAADLVLAFAGGFVGLGIGVALWGLHMGLTQGLLASLVADTAPAELRGTAFGLFNLVSGLAMLAASIIAGALWDAVGPRATFLAGAAFTALALMALPLAGRMIRHQQSVFK